MTPLHEDFRDFLRLLRSHRVRFVVVGGHALAAHGRPRYTGDLDVFVEPTPANARRVVAALRDFGFGSVDLVEADFATPGRVAQLGVPPVRIEILTRISGVDFSRAWAGRITARVAGVDVTFLGRRELLENKRAAGRPKDLADVALLEEADAPPRPPRKRPGAGSSKSRKQTAPRRRG